MEKCLVFTTADMHRRSVIRSERSFRSMLTAHWCLALVALYVGDPLTFTGPERSWSDARGALRLLTAVRNRLRPHPTPSPDELYRWLERRAHQQRNLAAPPEIMFQHF